MAACTAKKMRWLSRGGEDVITVRMMMKLVIGGDHRIRTACPWPPSSTT
jgi:hypothetical protein